MATQRLNNYMRGRIEKCVMSKTDFEETIDKLEAQKITAEELYEAYYDKKTLEKMYALPEGWLPERYSFNVNLGGYTDWLCFEHKNDHKVYKRFLSKDSNNNLTFETDHPITIRFQTLYQELEKARDEYNRFKNKVHATLQSASTLGKLLTIWPELKDICPPDLFYGTEPALPAIMVDDLNKHIKFEKAE